MTLDFISEGSDGNISSGINIKGAFDGAAKGAQSLLQMGDRSPTPQQSFDVAAGNSIRDLDGLKIDTFDPKTMQVIYDQFSSNQISGRDARNQLQAAGAVFIKR